uniref:Protein LTV1 homolog n=1 Tax=Oryzias latipes TaxID=8090 RepID=A0A3P9JGH5_ORYLA
MPHRKKKAFIEKKKAVTFHLVHRSQRDPLAADEKAPQHVLLPAAKVDTEKRHEEQRKFGVFFDDDYDYLQHLKEPSGQSELVAAVSSNRDGGSVQFLNEGDDEMEQEEDSPVATLHLPSSVFASEFEEEVGLLNKAAPISGPRLDMDPDIVAALDDDFDYENPNNILEDDFITKANGPAGGLETEGDYDDDDEWEDTDEEGDFGSEGGFSDEEHTGGDGRGGGDFLFMDEETKSRFTEYSLTSSVMRRSEQLSLLDDRFEKFYEQFDDDEIGALDNAELEGFIEPDSARLEEAIKDYFKEKEKNSLRPDDLGPKELPVLKEEDEETDEEMVPVVIEPSEEKWDCETIISTYSNLYNRPKVIEEPAKPKSIRVSSKTGIPLDVLPNRGLTAKQAERMTRINDSDLPRVSTQPRNKEESKEERKARKQLIKDERKERRAEKKANKMAFKEEKVRQEKQMLNLRTNVQGLKL